MKMSSHPKKIKSSLYTVKEVIQLPEFAYMTEDRLQCLIHESEVRYDTEGRVIPANGMIQMGVIKHIGECTFIDIKKLRAWVNGERPDDTMSLI